MAATRGHVLVFQDESGIVAGGIGGRYLDRPQESLWVGIDIAQGPEDTVFHIQVDHAWSAARLEWSAPQCRTGAS